MKIKLTLHRDKMDSADIVVTADGTSTISDVARSIVDADPTHSPLAGHQAPLTLMVSPPDSNGFVELAPDALVGESAVGSGFHAVVVPAADLRSRIERLDDSQEAAATITIEEGPHAGQVFSLPVGQYLLGRDASNDVVLDDVQVSKRHARVDVSPQSVEVIDLNSANGIEVDGEIVPRARITDPEVLTIGNVKARFELTGAVVDTESFEEKILERGGDLPFNRSPRLEPRYSGEKYDAPQVPNEKDPAPFPWTMVVAPHLHGCHDVRRHEEPDVAHDHLYDAAHDVRQLLQLEERTLEEGEARA